MVTPPPPPPPLETGLGAGTPEAEPSKGSLSRRSKDPRDARGRRWPLEALAAVVLLVVLAAAFHPVVPGAPTPAQRWADGSSRQIVALARDITTTQGALAAPVGAVTAHPPLDASSVLRLRRDLSLVARLAVPPGESLKRIWVSALDRVGAALQILAGARDGLTPAQRAAARADLDAAGQALVAVSAAARTPVRIHPH